MKKFISSVIAVLMTVYCTTLVPAADIIIGGTGESAKYTVEHYLESHTVPDTVLSLTQSLNGFVGTNTEAVPESFLGYSAQQNYKQSIVTADGSTTVAIEYTMDGFETGDVNCDGYIDLLDNVLLQRKLAGWEGYNHINTCLYTSDLNQNGNTDPLDTLMLLNSLAKNETESTDSQSTVSITIKDLDKTYIYEAIPGTQLPQRSKFVFNLSQYAFEGWYNSDYSKQYSVVPNSDAVLYAKYENTAFFDFSKGTLYDPNNAKRFSVVENPFGDGYVATATVTSSVSAYGTLKGMTPGFYNGSSTSGYRIKKGSSHIVRFKYRFANTDPSYSSCNLDFYASDVGGLGVNGSKTNVSLTTISGSENFSLTDGWTEVTIKFTNNTDHTYPYFRFVGTKTTANTIYIDDLVIAEQDNSVVKLTVHGKTTSTNLKVGDTLPAPTGERDSFTTTAHTFKGWYSSSSDTPYTTVANGVTSYYAVFEDYSRFTFETAGIYDPNSRYSATSGKLASWYRELDPTHNKNICLRVNLTNNTNNTNVALQISEGANGGFKLKNGYSYVITFDYYIATDSENFKALNFSIRGTDDGHIGIQGNKTDSLTSAVFTSTNKWEHATICMMLSSEITSSYDNLILLAQATTTDNKSCDNLKAYFDNIEIISFKSNTVRVATTVKNVTLNENGNKSVIPVS